MTTAEFDRWWSDLIVRFPSVETWLVKSAHDENSQRQVLRNWCSVFHDVPVIEAVEVNRQMQAGDLPWVGEYDGDKERLPQHVRRLAKQLAWEGREKPKNDPSAELKPTSFPAGKILRRMLELTDKGMSGQEAREIVCQELPVGNPKWEPRYDCLICYDAGTVTIASPTAIKMALAGRFHECHHREAAVRCSCKGYLLANVKHPIAIYDADKDYRIVDFLWREAETARFHDWCEAKYEEFWNSKRHSEFDAFNQREFAP
jgi:hypothetical protein